jgi:hypothetical protein
MSTLLNQPLPADAIAGTTWGPFSYRRYPVFSRPWLWRRTVFAVAATVLYGLLAGLGQRLKGGSWEDALACFGYFVSGGVLMASIGPVLATCVRCRGWSMRIERWAVIVAVVLGFVGAAASDYWASAGIEESFHSKDLPAAKRRVSDGEEAQLRLMNVIGPFIYFGLSGGLASLAYFSERRRMTARAAVMGQLESDHRLAVLQAQVEPHFLFNALASIRPLIREAPSQAEAALDALADHLRATVPQMRAGDSTFGQQMKIAESYLGVMRVRMGDRLHYESAVDGAASGVEFPSLMLLTLVENAIKHGLEPKPGPGSLHIEASVAAGALTVRVMDDGVGLRDGLSSGLGLANIRDHLALRFGSRASLQVAARPTGGTVASITVPAV